MALVCLVLSIALLIVYGILFLRPRLRLLSAAVISASIALLYLALALAVPQSEALSRLSIIMLGATGLTAVALIIAHFVFERGNAGALTGARKPRPPKDGRAP